MIRYRFDNQREKQKTSRTKTLGVIFVLVVIAVVAIFVVAPFIRNFLKGPAWFAKSIQESAKTTVATLTPKKSLLAHNAELKDQIQKLEAQLIDFKMIQDENIALRTELSYLPNPFSVTIAGILGKPSDSLFNSLILDQGSDDGISVGQLVTTQGTIGLGKISSVSAKTATVQLFSGPQFSGDLIMKNQNITVPALGKGGGNFEIHIPREIKVVDGDILALPEYPNLAIGVVKSIQFDARDPFQTVLARTPINVQELRFVEVVK